MEVDDKFVNVMSSVQRMLAEANVEEIRKLRQVEEFMSLLETKGIDVIEHILKFLEDEHRYKWTKGIECFEEFFKILVDEVNSVDCLITLLEQLDEDACCIEKFLILLIPIKLLLLKLSTSRGLWLEWALSTIESYIGKIPYPEDYENKFDKKIMLTEERYVDNVIQTAVKFCSFYESFVECSVSPREKSVLTSFGFHLLSSPIAYVYVENFPVMMRTQQTITDFIDRLTSHIYFLFEWLDETKMTNGLFREEADIAAQALSPEKKRVPFKLCEKISVLQLALYYATKTVDKKIFEIFPCVYDKLYLFHKMLFLGLTLSEHAHNAVARTGLLLVERLLNFIDDGFIPHYYLEMKLHREFVRIISDISVLSYIFENRQLAVRLLMKYLGKFNSLGTYLLYMNVFRATASPDVNGEIVSFYRRRIYNNFKEDSLEDYQKGKRLMDLLRCFSQLENGADTNLIKFKNVIISTLHLFVLILGRDTTNETGIRYHFDYFEQRYFSLLKLAVNNARENLKKEINSLRHPSDDSSRQVKEQLKMFDVIVGGEQLAPPKLEDKIESARIDLTVVDMIEKALELVYEYAEKYKLVDEY